MTKFKRGTRRRHQIGYWVRVPGSPCLTIIGYGKPLPGTPRKTMGGSAAKQKRRS